MAEQRFIISGFGGQGVMLMGMILAYAGMLEGKEVTWLPSYGPEMRGGTANCHVIVSDKPISSPIVSKASTVVAMNLPSLTKFQKHLVAEGKLFLNDSLINVKTDRKDIREYCVSANDIAMELYNSKIANMVMLGAIIKETGVVRHGTVEKVLEKVFSGDKAKLIPVNIEALKKGEELFLN
jgi:2-oxoglutarate ferredoxin oxidoreductase subunit gamma